MKIVLAMLLWLATTSMPVSAMNMYDDPRMILSFLDKSLPPELDILRVTTDISSDNELVFQVKTKGERESGEEQDYLLLHIVHEKHYVLLISINKERENKVALYEDFLHPKSDENHRLPQTFKLSPLPMGFSAKHIPQGAEFNLPLDWLNFGAHLGFDAYTVQARIDGNSLEISKIYDQARKGRQGNKLISTITLLNKICSPQR